MACAGTSIVALADRDDKSRPNSIGGDALCLLSAVFYACYTVAIKKMLGKDEDTNTALFFGYVGLINLVALAPVMLLLSLSHAISVANLTAGMFGLVVAKGEHFSCSLPPHEWQTVNQMVQWLHFFGSMQF